MLEPAVLVLVSWMSVAGSQASPGADIRAFVIFDAASAQELPELASDATGQQTAKAEWSARERRSARLQVQFGGGSTYAAFAFSATSSQKLFSNPDFPPEPEALLVRVRAAKGNSLVLQLTDSTGDVFEIEQDPTGNWEDLRFEISGDMKGWRKVVRIDGKLDPPIRAIAVGLRAKGITEGSLELERVALIPSTLKLELKTPAPGNIFLTGERPSGTVSFGRSALKGPVRLVFEDGYGRPIKEIPVQPGGALELELPGDFGFYYVRALASGYRPSPPACYTVIPDNRVEGKEPNSPFGVCCHWGDYWYKPIAAVLAKRAGIGWIRDGHHEDFTGPGGAYTESKKVGLCQMSITTYCPAKEQDVLTTDGRYDFKDFLARQSAYAKAVADHVDWYDMTNEPVFAWSKVFGSSGSPRRWVDIFCRYFTPQYYEAMQKSDPGAKLLAELYWNTDELEALIKSGSAKYIAALSPHFYAHKDDPEDHWSLRGGYRKLAELQREYGLKLPVWIGEIGFTTFIGTSQHYKSVTELEQAALLVRAMSMHFAAGVEKIFYYDLVEWTAATWGQDPSQDAYNCEFHFGLLRKDHTPKPALTAYANFIAQTKGARWLGRSQLGGDRVHVYAFARPGEPPALVAWCRKGTASIPVNAGARLTDIFGKTGTWGGGELPLSEIPIYIRGCSIDALGIAPIPTYAMLPRFHDSTDVRLGIGYGKGQTNGTRQASAIRTAETPAAPPVKRPPADVIAQHDRTLSARVREALTSGKGVNFFASSMRHNAKVMAIEGESLRLLVDPSGAALQMAKRIDELPLEDKKALALAVLREGVSADHCLAAFYLLATGDRERGELQLLKATPEDAQKVRSMFGN